MTRRACKSCGAYLRLANDTDYCWPCQPHDVDAVPSRVRAYNQPWTAEETIEAIRRWTEWMGRAPMKTEWSKSPRQDEPEHPTAYSVYKLFPSWYAALDAAGVKPPRVSPGTRRAAVLDCLPARTADIEAVLRMRNAGTRSLLNRMRKDGVIEIDADGIWYRVEAQAEAA
jgi:hypothetical protein